MNCKLWLRKKHVSLLNYYSFCTTPFLIFVFQLSSFRFCLWVFTLFTVIATIAVLLSAPHIIVQQLTAQSIQHILEKFDAKRRNRHLLGEGNVLHILRLFLFFNPAIKSQISNMNTIFTYTFIHRNVCHFTVFSHYVIILHGTITIIITYYYCYVL